MLVPPNPNELLNAKLTWWSIGVLGTKFTLKLLEGFSKFNVAGIKLLLMLKIEKIASTLPAAPNKWPIDDFVELTNKF